MFAIDWPMPVSGLLFVLPVLYLFAGVQPLPVLTMSLNKVLHLDPHASLSRLVTMTVYLLNNFFNFFFQNKQKVVQTLLKWLFWTSINFIKKIKKNIIKKNTLF